MDAPGGARHAAGMTPPCTRRRALGLLAASSALGLGACANSSPPAEIVRGYAPTGRLRACINLGNPILARRDAASGQAQGVSVDLARRLGAELGVPVDLVVVEAAAKSVETVRAGAALAGAGP